MTKLVEFFRNERSDVEGRFLDDMLENDYEWMEKQHDFVQWWFPLTEASAFNPKAPRLTEADIYAIQHDSEAMFNYMACVNRMLAFFGFKFSSGDVITSDEFENRCNVLCGPSNHNHLRFTRLLLSMYYFGFGKQAKLIHAAVSARATDETSKRFWDEAVTKD